MSDWITVTIAQARGSTPREAGTEMRVFAGHQIGTIGGGTLEWRASETARAMLEQGRETHRETLSLGPDTGQCCGGQVVLDYARNAPQDDQRAPSLWIWGAGHTGRAIARVLAPLDSHEITLIDVSADRFPAELPEGVTPLIAADPVLAVKHAPREGAHLILTYSHALDLALCDRVLHHGFDTCGLIGSATKWARFRKRLGQMGHENDQIERIDCPIGDPRLGKHPQAIALGVAAAMLARNSTPIPEVKSA